MKIDKSYIEKEVDTPIDQLKNNIHKAAKTSSPMISKQSSHSKKGRVLNSKNVPPNSTISIIIEEPMLKKRAIGESTVDTNKCDLIK